MIVLVEAGAPRGASRATDADVEPVDAIDPTRRYARVRGDGPALGGDVERRAGTAPAPPSPRSSSASASARST